MDDKSKSQSLGEIGHLFLTDLRKRHTEGAPLPKRKSPAVSIDIDPEESEEGASASELSTVLGHHLGQGALQRVRAYAGHLATTAQRVGLIEIGEDGLRLTCFDASHEMASDAPVQPAVEPADQRRITQALAEMSWDIRRWVLFVAAGPKSIAARTLITQTQHWTLLVSADDQGTVTAYRALKSLAAANGGTIGLAVVGADDEAQAKIICRKVAGASKQFLQREIEDEGMVLPVGNITESVALWCRAGANVQDHWNAVTRFVEDCIAPKKAEESALDSSEDAAAEQELSAASAAATPASSKAPAQPRMQLTEPIPMPTLHPAPAAAAAMLPVPIGYDDIIDLPSDADSARITEAVLLGQSEWIASPVKAPFCEFASIAVDRDGRLTMLAAASGGISQLPQISRAYAWLIENRALVRLALPQLNIDATSLPKLTLFVDEGDSSSGELTAVLQTGSVCVRSYRRLKWGDKTGLLLARAA